MAEAFARAKNQVRGGDLSVIAPTGIPGGLPKNDPGPQNNWERQRRPGTIYTSLGTQMQ